MFNIKNEIFIQRAKLKSQGSKNYYYGEDGVIEEALSKLEGKLSYTIKEIIKNERLPRKQSSEHFELLKFLILTDFRNPVRIESMKGMNVEARKRMNELNNSINSSESIPEYTHEDTIKDSFLFANEMIEMIVDLDYKLIINVTDTPFLTSDFPIIKYNQFLEQKKWTESKIGFGVTGLQIFVPITPKLMILFYDSGIYKVGFKKRQIHELNDKKDIDNINILNFINCFNTIYFDHQINEQYVRRLFTESKKYKRANIPNSKLSYLVNNIKNHNHEFNDKEKNLIVLNTTDCETKLDISGVKIHSKGKKHKLESTVAQLRPHAERIMLGKIKEY